MIIQSRVKRLKKVVNEYLPFVRWEAVNVFLKDGYVFVMWLKPQIRKGKDGGDDAFDIAFTHHVFPVSDLNKKIRSYKNKIIVEEAKLKEEKE